MRLPQQRRAVASHLDRVWLSRRTSTTPDQRQEYVRPAYSSGGTADCYARCAVLPPGPDRTACMLDCY